VREPLVFLDIFTAVITSGLNEIAVVSDVDVERVLIIMEMIITQSIRIKAMESELAAERALPFSVHTRLVISLKMIFQTLLRGEPF
jgi:hypothetical protein